MFGMLKFWIRSLLLFSPKLRRGEAYRERRYATRCPRFGVPATEAPATESGYSHSIWTAPLVIEVIKQVRAILEEEDPTNTGLGHIADRVRRLVAHSDEVVVARALKTTAKTS